MKKIYRYSIMLTIIGFAIYKYKKFVRSMW
jgi:hypothetical protein